MIRKIIHTTGTKVIETILNFVFVWLCSYFLGSETYGKITLLILIVFLFSQINGIIIGNSLLYFASRYSKRNILIIAFSWITIISFFIFSIFVFSILIIEIKYKTFNTKELLSIPVLIFLSSSTSIFRNYLLGRQYVIKANYLGIFLISSRVILLIFLFFVIKLFSIWAFIFAFALSNIMVFLFYISDINSINNPKENNSLIISSKQLFKSLFSYGFAMQSSSVLQILNQRISYFFISFLLPISNLGVFSLAVQITESIKLIGTSISDVLLIKLSNTKNKHNRIQIAIISFRFTLYFSILSLLFILIIPQNIYILIFSSDYYNIKKIILSLLIGVFAHSGLLIIIQYFNGNGKPIFNFFISLIGIIITSIIQIPLINSLGLIGAGIANSIMFIISLSLGIKLFLMDNKQCLRQLAPQKQDFVMIINQIKPILTLNNK